MNHKNSIESMVKSFGIMSCMMLWDIYQLQQVVQCLTQNSKHFFTGKCLMRKNSNETI